MLPACCATHLGCLQLRSAALLPCARCADPIACGLGLQVIEPKMVEEMRRLRGLVTIGTVGGSDLAKQIEQLGQSGERLLWVLRLLGRFRGTGAMLWNVESNLLLI